MKLLDSTSNSPERKRRYLVHLTSTCDEKTGTRCYISHIRPWSGRDNLKTRTEERKLGDECEMIATVNPLLPSGSDIRDVLGHIETAEGFLYLLTLTHSEAATLGWLEV